MSPTLRLLSILSLAWSAVPVAAQCSPFWSSAAPQADVSGNAVCSTLWDPDGNGPAPQRLVIGGDTLIGGSAAAGQRVMTWDGSQWQSLGNGPGTTGQVRALTTWNGLLVAAGTFTGGGTDRIALWNGSTWQPLGPGLAFTPLAIAEWNGNLVAVLTGGPSIWNGAAWSTLPAPPTIATELAVVSFQGLLCVAGSTGFSSGVLERWNGTSWLPSIPANGVIYTLGVRSFQLNSTLFAGGAFTSIGSPGTAAARIASTNGATAFAWLAVGGGLSGTCFGLHARATSALGTTVVVRTSSPQAPVMQYSGSSFNAMSTTPLSSLSFYGGSYHGTANGLSAAACLRYDGTTWAPVRGQSIDGEVRALTRSGPDMIVGGTIQSTSGTALNRIARWNGTTFQPLASGVSGSSVDALLTLDNGDIIAGGVFLTASGFSANNIARWNGTTWSSVGTGFDQQVLALCKMPNGDLIAGGRFTMAGAVPCARIARWNGTAWSPLGFGMNGDVLALAVRGDGTLFAGGAFTTAGGIGCSRIAQWNGTSWLPVGTGCTGDVHALAVRPNQEVIAAGAFLNAGGLTVQRCARWTGSAWATMGAATGDPSIARSVMALSNGDVVAGRGFHQPTATIDSGISRWNGITWSGFDTGLAANPAITSVSVRALAQRADGALIVGGDFGIAGGLVARGLAKLSTPCPPLASPYGTGCASTAGPLVLTAETLPWLGAMHRTAITGLATGSLCFAIIGFTPLSIPLQSLVSQGQPGCSLLASADSATLQLPDSTGTARSTLALPPIPSLIGAVFFQQSIPLEINGLGALSAVRGSNALALTIGTL